MRGKIIDMEKNKIEEISRRRGFFWQGSEIYGGLSGIYDYAHLGSLLKNKWENEWRKFFLGMDDNFFEIQPAEIMHERVWQASGHVESFVDPVVKCKGMLEEIGVLNLMFPLTMGNDAKAYLRGETAQAVYVNFSREFECLRKKLPLGLAIVGKAFRNEISPRQLLIRLRELTQAELQIFFDPDRIEEHPRFDEVKDYKLFVMPVKNRA